MNILQLCRMPVYPPRNGSAVRVSKTVEKLSDLGDLWLATPPHDTTKSPSGVSDVPLDTPFLTERLLRNEAWLGLFTLDADHILQRRTTDSIVSRVGQLDPSFDLVVSEFPQVNRAAREIADDHGAPLLVNKHNAASEILDTYLKQRPVPAIVRERAATNLQAFERQTVSKADMTVFQSASDAARFNDIDGATTRVVPNGCDYERIQAGGDPTAYARRLSLPSEMPVCVFVGSYGYGPNREAASVIIDDLATARPDVAFLLVGRDAPETEQSNVHSLGYVDDLAGVLSFADIALCPLVSGSGTKLKMLDYLAAGLPVVTTPIGTQGLPVSDGEELLITQSTAEFDDAITQLLDDRELRERLSERGQQVAAAHAWSTLMDEYDAIVDQLLAVPQK